MKKGPVVLISLVMLFCAGFSSAQTTTQHNVTINVSAISVLEMTGGGDLTINITSASDPGAEPDDAQSTDRGLEWTTNETSKKITVQSDAAYTTFTLKALATSITGSGSAAAEVTFADTDAHDFITGIATETGSCTIRYTASAEASAGAGNETHQITYTITDAS
jgi:hypothetical protein